MTDIRVAQDSAARNALKEERARDAARAMREYETEQKAIATRTERLKALRLAKEAAESAAEAEAKPTKKRAAKTAAEPKPKKKVTAKAAAEPKPKKKVAAKKKTAAKTAAK